MGRHHGQRAPLPGRAVIRTSRGSKAQLPGYLTFRFGLRSDHVASCGTHQYVDQFFCFVFHIPWPLFGLMFKLVFECWPMYVLVFWIAWLTFCEVNRLMHELRMAFVIRKWYDGAVRKRLKSLHLKPRRVPLPPPLYAFPVRWMILEMICHMLMTVCGSLQSLNHWMR
jgi:hypothetical protein